MEKRLYTDVKQTKNEETETNNPSNMNTTTKKNIIRGPRTEVAAKAS